MRSELQWTGTEFHSILDDEPSPLEESSIVLGLKGETRDEIIDELLDVAVRSRKVTDPKAARRALKRREDLAGTGWRNEIAVPHCRTEAVPDLVAVLGVAERGVYFRALDGRPSRIFLLTMAPPSLAGAQLGLISRIEMHLRNPRTRESVLTSSTVHGALEALGLRPALA